MPTSPRVGPTPASATSDPSRSPGDHRREASGFNVALVGVFAAFCAVMSVLPAIPVGPVAVPITLQTLAVYLTGLVLGGRRGGAAVLLYVLVGVAGLPVFAGFRGGPGVLAGPSAGYIVGFAVAGFLTGAIAYRVLRRSHGSGARLLGLLLAAVVGGFLVTRLLGVPGLALNGGLTLRDAFLADLIYWPGDLVKCVAAALVAAAVHRAFPRLAARR